MEYSKSTESTFSRSFLTLLVPGGGGGGFRHDGEFIVITFVWQNI